ncbi:MAG: carbon-monoxide dehydrogenase medium subunit [Ignavibacteria bacterium]|nr:MAG: carbon-monoxide dehydrogenase medium subunit [Ignavibacteria bacterium]KAF0159132.1 MAG: carbon-monoxide dehydrogenase medium subunit [Ignavibacteria bacterium]
MIDLKCEVLTPNSLAEALQYLANNNEYTKILAGGTDVIVGKTQGSKRFIDSNVLVDINRISEIRGIEENDCSISIGAATTLGEICNNKIVGEKLPLLKKAASMVGSQQIRNRATIAGNFVNNAPCADTVPALLVYDTSIEIKSHNSERIISLQEFLKGPYQTQLQKEELVTRIIISQKEQNYFGEFYKLGRRRAVAISRLTLAVLIALKEKQILDIKIASGAVTPIGTRFPKLEEFAKGKIMTDVLCKNIAKKMGEEVLGVTGLRWSSAYKLPVVQQMFYQLLKGIER